MNMNELEFDLQSRLWAIEEIEKDLKEFQKMKHETAKPYFEMLEPKRERLFKEIEEIKARIKSNIE